VLYGRVSLGWQQAVAPADLTAYAHIASPSFTGFPQAPTATAGTNTNQLASTAFVAAALSGKADLSALSSYAPLASPALTGTPTAPTASGGTNTTQLATTAFVASAIVPLAPIASPTFTGAPKSVTAAVNDNSTNIATTAFSVAQIAAEAIRFDANQGLTTAQQGVALRNIAAAQFNLINGKLVESHASNAATFAIKTLAGADPSASDPVTCIFPDSSWLAIIAALSLTLPSGFSFGPGNAVPFRVWFFLCNDGGVPRIGARVMLIPAGASAVNTMAALWGPAPDFMTSNAATGVGGYSGTYTDVAMGTARPYRYIARAEYDSGLATAGTWNVSPNRIVMLGANSKMPGDIIQSLSFKYGGSGTGTTSATLVATTTTINVPPLSLYSLMRVQMTGDCTTNVNNNPCYVALCRGSTPITPERQGSNASAGSSAATLAITVWDWPRTTATVTYGVYIRAGNAGQIYVPATNDEMIVDEVVA
jgi:hypothetical protein